METFPQIQNPYDFTVPDAIVTLRRTDGTEIVKIDAVAARLYMTGEFKDSKVEPPEIDLANSLTEYVKRVTKVELEISQAYTLLLMVDAAWKDFKKKLGQRQTSP